MPTAVAIPSPSNIGYRPGDMALLGLVMAALLVLCLIVIGFLISRLWKGNDSTDKVCEVSGALPAGFFFKSSSTFVPNLYYYYYYYYDDDDDDYYTIIVSLYCISWVNITGVQHRSDLMIRSLPQCLPCLKSDQSRTSHRDSLQYTNDGFQNEADQNRGSSRRWNNTPPRRSTFPLSRGRIIPMERRSRLCSSCGVYSNHVPKGSPLVRRGIGDGDEYSARSSRAKQRRKEGQKTVWFKESKDSSDIEVEIIPDTVGRVEEETEEELEVEMEAVVRDPAAPLKESDGGQESEDTEQREEQGDGNAVLEKEKESQEEA